MLIANVSSLDYNVVEHSQPNRSVTLIAKMSKGTDENNQIWFREIGGITIKSEHIPLLIGTLIGAFLILLLIVAFLLWKCCISSEENKTREAVNISTIEKSHFSNQNYSNAFSDPRTPRTYSSRVVELIPEHDGPIYWVYKNHEFPPVPYGSTGNTEPCTVSNIEVIRPPRPRSNPTVPPSVSSLVDDYTLPEISEFCAHTCQYSLSNGLDECHVKGYNVNNYKTRSLPSCVRHKRRSSNDDDANNFYDKVNFSKKRKNRMRNDEAAIIALSKSRSQFFNKDTDTLVDNEAVIVYDERTAL